MAVPVNAYGVGVSVLRPNSFSYRYLSGTPDVRCIPFFGAIIAGGRRPAIILRIHPQFPQHSRQVCPEPSDIHGTQDAHFAQSSGVNRASHREKPVRRTRAQFA